MSWGTLLLSDEVDAWLASLSERDYGRVQFHIDRLGELGPELSAPHARHLGGKLWELRFHLATGEWRVTYFFGPRRSIILLTVFPKTRQREQSQVARARSAMAQVAEILDTERGGR